jgi:fused signal recognition particle receptor
VGALDGIRKALGLVRERAKDNQDVFTDSILSQKIREEKLDEILEEMEMVLLSSDVALPVAGDIRKRMRVDLLGRRVKLGIEVDGVIDNAGREAIGEVLRPSKGDFDAWVKAKLAKEKPAVIMFVGINGTGKTTTIAKVGFRLREQRYSVLFAAGDTFRAGAIEQLSIHGERLGIPVVKQKAGADPAAVAFDAIQSAKAKGIQVVLVDTAGRMQTNVNLMDEMKKVKRVAKPHLTIFVGDALTGNDAIEQARTFQKEIGVDGVILCKVDADAKGGSALSIAYEIKKPIFFIGVGQEYRNLAKFNPEWMMKRIFPEDDEPVG